MSCPRKRQKAISITSLLNIFLARLLERSTQTSLRLCCTTRSRLLDLRQNCKYSGDSRTAMTNQLLDGFSSSVTRLSRLLEFARFYELIQYGV